MIVGHDGLRGVARANLTATDDQRDVNSLAGHLFEEPSALERVELLARTWFLRWLGDAAPLEEERTR